MIRHMLGVLLFLGVFFFTGWMAIDEHMKAMSSESWKCVSGDIVSSNVERRSSRRSTSYEPCVTYHYQVAGKDYSASKIGFDRPKTLPTASQAEQISAQYPQRSLVNVYFNPARPEEACLKTGASNDYFMQQMMLSGIFLVIAIILPFLPNKRR